MSGNVTSPPRRDAMDGPESMTETPAVSDAPRRRPQRRRRSRLLDGLGITFLRILVFVVFCAIWALVAGPLGWADPFWVSTPSRVFDSLIEQLQTSEVLKAVGYTLYEAVLGLVIGSVAGIAAGLLLASNRVVDQVLAPYMTLLNTIPRFALAPLFIVYFGLGAMSKIVLVISMVFFVLMVSTYGGYQSVDRDLKALMTVLGASRRHVFLKLYLPTIMPWIFTALHLALAYALASAVVGEMISAQYGLGVLITRESGLFNISGVFGLLIILAILSVVLDLIIRAVERPVLRWRYVGQSGDTT